jgi:hypothetical protein
VYKIYWKWSEKGRRGQRMTGWCGGFGRCCVVQEAGETRCAMNMCRSAGEGSEGGQGESQDGTLYDEAFLLKDAQCLIRHELNTHQLLLQILPRIRESTMYSTI